jgi:DNA-binding XRE family transcriptional regulator
MGSYANPSLIARGGTHRSLSGRWHGSPPHNYAIQLVDAAALPSDLNSLAQSGGGEKCLSIDVSSRFGRRLRELRLQRSLTQSEMARKFGIDRSFISDVERGRKSISLPMIEVIALGMNLSLAKLFEDL